MCCMILVDQKVGHLVEQKVGHPVGQMEDLPMDHSVMPGLLITYVRGWFVVARLSVHMLVEWQASGGSHCWGDITKLVLIVQHWC